MNKDNKLKNGLVIDKYGSKRWYKDDKLHREDDLPAVEHINGHKVWFWEDQMHRDNKPAVVAPTGQEWWVNGKLHREDGPAIDYDDNKEWYINNKKISEQEFNIKKFKKELEEKLPINSSNSKPFKV